MLRIVPQKIKTITIIGSKGEMGKIFKSSFQKQGLRVIEIEQKTPFSKWESLLADSQMIIVSVPIEKTPSVEHFRLILLFFKDYSINLQFFFYWSIGVLLQNSKYYDKITSFFWKYKKRFF